MTALLKLQDVKKRFGEHTLFDIPALEINAGTAYVLTGPNGSGKSTLLRILGGLETAEIGRAEFHGQSLAFSPYPHILRQSIVYVHQHPVMFSTSVADNIGYGLRARGFSARDCDTLVEDAMAWAGVSHLRQHKPETLSGGEKQQVALARAKVLNPELLLLDEPTASLDGTAREQVVALLPDLAKSGGAIVMASHDQGLISLSGLRHMDLRDGFMTYDKPFSS